MKDENLDIDLIERFQEGKLTDEERQVFHQRLLEDEAFAKTVQLQLNITEEIETFWTNDMIIKIEEWEKTEQRKEMIKATPTPISATPIVEQVDEPKTMDIPQEVKTKKSRNWVKFVIAFVVLLLIVAIGWYFIQPKESVDLFVTNFEPYEDVIENHSAEDSDLLTLAMGAYSQKDYSVAMIILKRFLNEVDSILPENRTAAEFYLAVSNLGTGNANTAKKQFETIVANGNNPFQEQAEWYIVLANIKTNNVIKAKIQLTKIQTNSNHSYKKQADKLLKSLP